MNLIKRNTTFIMTMGTYDDYHVLGVFIAMTNINAKELQESYLKEHEEQKGNFNFKKLEFIKWATERGIRQVDHLELTLGEDSTAEFMLFKP